MAVRAISPQQTGTTFQCLPCDWANQLCQAVYDLAMKIFNAIKDLFQSTPAAQTAPVVQRGAMTSALNLIAFYRGEEPNNNGVTLDQILSWDDARLESVHNYIQWIFPTDFRSGPNPTAPVLDADAIEVFRNDPVLKFRVLSALRRMLSFYGLQRDEGTGRISRGPNFAPRLENFLTNTHNFSRISRILRSLNLLGLDRESRALWEIMLDIYNHEGRGRIPVETTDHWINSYLRR
jgi:hypothetical protein